MRLLLTTQPIYSHLVPALVPLAHVARAAGHEVAVATAASMADELARHGVAHLPLPNVPGQVELRSDPRLAERFGLPQQLMAPGRRSVDPAVWRQIARAYAGPIAGHFAADLLDVAGRWRPDVIVREPAEYGGYLTAERLDIPHATLDISPFAALDLPVVVDALDEQRVALGLPSTADPWHPHRHLRAGLIPEAFYPPSLRPVGGRYYRPPTPTDDAPMDPWYADLPADRPLVLASLGSLVLSLPGIPDVLPLVVAALGELPCTAVVSLGGYAELTERIGTVPENVRLTPFVPQRTLLPACDLFLTHAGFNSTGEAVAAGVPMVAVPAVADQPPNARRIAELGLGLRLDIDDLSVARIADACRQVLTEPAYRWRVRALQRQLLANPGFERLVADLAELAVLARPVEPARRVSPLR
ncbi:glycosyltransferase [Micromonospora polyrhachis]|uniref:N-glycosyltransferase n=1 Tax=Micromonospora polyrhachis TaxID=1282883 RepID=A0A7W7SLJ6_9ACTN|nr:glycosyltransferase [Micromonospora polyrhachis]MBB4956964.1 N-glycosyltransferase [Micromonospora polyrhachis]